MSDYRSSRLVKNPAERDFQLRMAAEGWTVTKRGWPDFSCRKDGSIALVEVKSGRELGLRASQYLLMRELAKYGVPCYMWANSRFDKVGVPEDTSEVKLGIDNQSRICYRLCCNHLVKRF